MLKTLLGLVVLLLIAGVGFLAWTLAPAALDTPAGVPQVAAANPEPPPGMGLSIIEAGYMESIGAFAYRGGPFEPFIAGMAAALVQHPEGALLIDTGFGSHVDAHYQTIPKLMQWVSSYTAGTPVAERVRANGYDMSQLRGIYLTHGHWDHVSGLPDFPGVAAYLPDAATAFIASGHESVALLRQFIAQDKTEIATYRFDDGPYENFERSHDIYGDGSVVIVPLPGHTPGSVGIFVNLPSGARYLFAGDVVWARAAVKLPAEKPWLTRKLVDYDAQATRAAIIKLHELAQRYPELIIVPAHGRRVHEQIAQYPEFEQ